MTLVGEPFVFITSMPRSGLCEELDDAHAKRKHVKCSGKVYGEHVKLASTDKDDHCCYGMRLAAVLHWVNANKIL